MSSQWLPRCRVCKLPIAVILAALSCAGIMVRASSAAEPAVAKSVELTVDYGDGVQKRFTALDWQEGLTVLDAMRAAKKYKRGIDFQTEGEAEMNMLVALDGQKNEGGGGTSKNWVYRVNGKLAHKSFAIQSLSAGDVVLWRFEVYDQ